MSNIIIDYDNSQRLDGAIDCLFCTAGEAQSSTKTFSKEVTVQKNSINHIDEMV